MITDRTCLRFCRVATASLVLYTSGCALFTRDYYEAYRPPPRQLHEVMAVRLEELSRLPPVSVEEAAAETHDRAAKSENPPESIDIDLAEMRAAALANNLDLKVELVNPSLAEATVNEERAQFEALLFGSLEHSRTDRPTRVIGGPAEEAQSSLYNAGVQIPLRTGGTVAVELPLYRFDDQTAPTGSAGDNAPVIDPSYEAGLRFSISQPLLRNAGIRANTHFIRVAKFERDLADARTKLAAIRILATADRAYWLLYAARRELEVRQEQYGLALQQLDDAAKRVAAGDAPEIEIMRAESGVAARLEGIIIAQTEVQRRQRDLKRIMNRENLPMSSNTEIVPTTEPNPLGLALDPEALAEHAITNRMEMLELELQLAVDASTIDLERNAALPLFVLDYSYQMNGLGGGGDEAFRHLSSNRYADHTVSLRAEIPIGNQAAKARVRRAVLQRVQRLASREQRSLAIRQEVYDAVDALQRDWQRILAARQEVILAARTYEGEKRQFEVGLRTSTDVLEAAAGLAFAQSREIQALAAYEISQVDIAFAAGTLIGHDRVIWKPTGIDRE
jgi:outer membrane protein